MQIIKLILAAALFGAATVTSAPMSAKEREHEVGSAHAGYKRGPAVNYIEADFKRGANVEADYKRGMGADYNGADYKKDVTVDY